MDATALVYPYNGMLLSNKNELLEQQNMNASQNILLSERRQ